MRAPARVQAERAARGVQGTVEGLQTQLDAACAAERARATEAQTHLEAARRLRGEREQLAAQLAEARGALGAAVGDADGLRSAVRAPSHVTADCSRLQHWMTLIFNVVRVLTQVDARTALLDRVWADARACLATLGHTTASGRASAAAAAGALHERGGDAGGLQDWAMQLCQERCARAMAEIRAAVAQQHVRAATQLETRPAKCLRVASVSAAAPAQACLPYGSQVHVLLACRVTSGTRSGCGRHLRRRRARSAPPRRRRRRRPTRCGGPRHSYPRMRSSLTGRSAS